MTITYSVVFCMVKNIRDKEEVKNALSVDEADVVKAIRGCDYADDRLKKGSALVQEDVDWLAFCMGIKGEKLLIKPEIVEIDGKEYFYWAIPANKLKETIEKDIYARINRIKEELAKEKPDIITIAYEAYLRKGFFFYLPETGFLNGIDLYDYVLNSRHFSDLEYLYVVKTIDYRL